MAKANRTIGALMVFGGAALAAIDILADTVRGVNNYFSSAQLYVALASLLIVVVGGALLLAAADVAARDDDGSH